MMAWIVSGYRALGISLFLSRYPWWGADLLTLWLEGYLLIGAHGKLDRSRLYAAPKDSDRTSSEINARTWPPETESADLLSHLA